MHLLKCNLRPQGDKAFRVLSCFSPSGGEAVGFLSKGPISEARRHFPVSALCISQVLRLHFPASFGARFLSLGPPGLAGGYHLDGLHG